MILKNTLLPKDKVHAIPADSGKIFQPIPVIDRVIDADVASIKTFVYPDFNFVLRAF